MGIVLAPHEIVKQGVENVGLQQGHNEEFSTGGGVKHPYLLGEVLGVLLFGVWVDIEADGIEATFVND